MRVQNLIEAGTKGILITKLLVLKVLGEKYSLIVLEGGRGEDRPCLCFDLLIGQKLYFFLSVQRKL